MQSDINLERVLEINVYNLYKSSLIGNAPQFILDLHQFLIKPEPGNLVMEITTIHDETRTGTRIGWLEEIVEQEDHTDEEWKELKEQYNETGERPTRTVYYIKTLSGEVQSWDNCQFIRVPESIFR